MGAGTDTATPASQGPPARSHSAHARQGRTSEGGGLRSVAAVVAIAAVVGLVLLLAMPPSFMQNDEGVKFIQAQGLLASGGTDRALDYPGRFADPTGRYFPLRPPFAWTSGGRWYGLYPTPFVAASALAWRLGGFRALYALPWMGALWVLALTGLLASRAFGGGWLPAAVTAILAIATPMLLYGTLHFEHTIGVALALGALLLLSEAAPTWQRLALAGALIGLGPAVRTELYCFPIAVACYTSVLWGIRLATLRRLLVVGAAALAVAAAFWAWNLVTLGTWDPVVTVNQAVNHRRDLSATLILFFPAHLPKLLGQPAWLALAVAAAAGFIPPRAGLAAAAKWTLALAAVAWVGYLAWRALPITSSGDRRTIIGLFATSPLAVLGLIRGPLPAGPPGKGRIGPACAAAGAAFMLAVFATDLEAAAGGLQLGARYLLPAVPLLVLSAADLVRCHRRLALVPALVLLGLSICATATNAYAEHRVRGEGAAILAACRAAGASDIVTNFWWVPHILAPLYPDHRIYYAPDDALLAKLLAKGVSRVVRVHGGLAAHRGPQVEVTEEAVLLPPQQVIVYRLSPASAPHPGPGDAP